MRKIPALQNENLDALAFRVLGLKKYDLADLIALNPEALQPFLSLNQEVLLREKEAPAQKGIIKLWD